MRRNLPRCRSKWSLVTACSLRSGRFNSGKGGFTTGGFHQISTSIRHDVQRPIGKAVPGKLQIIPRTITRSFLHGKILPNHSGQECSHTSSFSPSERKRMSTGQRSSPQNVPMRRAMIALGSNIGDRVNMIEKACEMMASHRIHVTATSLLYESAPMYVTDQDPFYNGVCEVRSLPNLPERQG
jgi:hypothetical protein